jgi:hypothetical protein
MSRTNERRYTREDLCVIPWRAWCASKGISIDTARRMRERGKAPRIIKISDRRIGVTIADDREWTMERIRNGVVTS